MKTLRSYKQQLLNATDDIDAPYWLTLVTRIGYAARGVVFLLVGGLAVLAALGRGGQTGDSKDAMQATMNSPGGWVWLTLLAVGLVAFSLWRLFQAITDPDHAENDFKSVGRRVGFVIGAVIYGALAVAAIGTAWGSGGGGSNTDQHTAWLMDKPFGRWLVGGVGLGIAAYGVGMVVKAWRRKFERKLNLSTTLAQRLRPVCRFGIAARGVAFVIVGSFFLYAAIDYNPSEAGGLREVFEQTRSQPFGQILLAVLAAGLFSYGVYGLVQAKYRRIGLSKRDGQAS